MAVPVAWNAEILLVERLILPLGTLPSDYRHALQELAGRIPLATADESTEPRPGDFWLGVDPSGRTSWRRLKNVGYASVAELGPAVLRLVTAAAWTDQRPQPVCSSSPWRANDPGALAPSGTF